MLIHVLHPLVEELEIESWPKAKTSQTGMSPECEHSGTSLL